MKKPILLIAVLATLLFGCKTQQKATTYNTDDVYSTGHSHAKSPAKQPILDEDLSATGQVAAPDSVGQAGAASATDYSEDSYAARIKHFSGQPSGLNYHDDYFASSPDSTQPAESSPDVNIYLGSSWGSSFWGPSFSFGFGYGYGWGDCCWGYPYWYYPYDWYYPYYGWGYPYYGYYPYPNYYDYPYWGESSYNGYYGPRRELSSTDGGKNSRTAQNGSSSNLTTDKNPRTSTNGTSSTLSTDKNPRADAGTGNIQRPPDQTKSGRAGVYTAPNKQRYTYSRPPTPGNTRDAKSYPGARTRSDRAYAQRQQAAPKYSKPGSQPAARSANPQTYSSPAYRQPKSSQEYINPRTQQGQSSGARENQGTRNYSNPGSSGKRYSSPGNSGSGYRTNPGTSGGSRSYSSPQRSYSSPGYSSPSRSSSPSYSAPSRSSSPSGGSSGGGRSSGGSSGGSGGGGGGGHRR